MACAILDQVRLLTWKSFQSKKRRPIATLIEFLLPIVLVLFLCMVRWNQPPNKVDIKTVYESRALSSAGIFAVLRSFCTTVNYDDYGFQKLDNSTLPQLLESIDNSVDDINELMDFHIQLRSFSSQFSHILEENNTFESRLIHSNDTSCEANPKLCSFLEEKAPQFANASKILWRLSVLQANLKRIQEALPRDEDPNIADGDTPVLSFLWRFQRDTVCGGAFPKRYSDVTQSMLTATHVSDNQLMRFMILAKYVRDGGKIVYAPDVPIVQSVIEEANTTFSFLADIRGVIDRFEQHNINLQSLVEGGVYSSSVELVKLYHVFLPLYMNRLDVEMSQFREELMSDVEKWSRKIGNLWNRKWTIWRKKRDGRTGAGEPELVDAVEHADWARAMTDLPADVNNTISAISTTYSLINDPVSQFSFFRGFENETMLMAYVNNYHDNETVIAAVLFDDDIKELNKGRLGPVINYRIRQNSSFVPTTLAAENFNSQYAGPSDWDDQYYTFGFLYVQEMIERAMITVMGGTKVREPGTVLQIFPFPCFEQDDFVSDMVPILPLLLALSWMFAVAVLVETVVAEKEKGLKQMMHSMGLRTVSMWLGWLTTVVPIATLSNVAMCLFFWGFSVLPHTSTAVLFLLFEIYIFAAVSFAFLLSSMFLHAKTATSYTAIIYFVAIMPCLYIAIVEKSTYKIVDWELTLLACFVVPSAFGIALKYVMYADLSGSGYTFGNLMHNPIHAKNSAEIVNVGTVMFVMILASFLYLFIAAYLNRVNPGQHGIADRWDYAVVALLRWIRKKRGKEEEREEIDYTVNGREAGIILREVSKKFKKRGARMYAVNRLSMEMYKGDVTCLLGDNGAGKSTTMKMICGMTQPSDGSVHVNGSIGMCPQHNVLFEKLTVWEHLYFYSRLKNPRMDKVERSLEVERMLLDIGLEAKRDAFGGQLSGGMQRRLSIGIAFIGDSRCVILDEPTAGVDPHARRAIWKLLAKYKKTTTILVATHHMDEADTISDRIFVISEGEMRASGSPLELKEEYGDGYRLSVVSRDQDAVNALLIGCGPTVHDVKKKGEQAIYTLTGWSDEQIGAALTKLQSVNAEMVSASGSAEPAAAVRGPLVTAYGLNDDTLEDIFMKLMNEKTAAEKEEYSVSAEEMREHKHRDEERSDPIDFSSFARHEGGWRRKGSQLLGLLLKRALVAVRSWKTLCSQLLLPVLFVLMGMGVALPNLSVDRTPPRLELSTAQYLNASFDKQTTYFLFSNFEQDWRYPYANLTQPVEEDYYSGWEMIEQLTNPAGPDGVCVFNDQLDYHAYRPYKKVDLGTHVVIWMMDDHCKRSVHVSGEYAYSPTLGQLRRDNSTNKKFLEMHCLCDSVNPAANCPFTQYGHGVERARVRMLSEMTLMDLTGVSRDAWIIAGTRKYDERRDGSLDFGYQQEWVPVGFGSGGGNMSARDELTRLAVRRVTKVGYDNRPFHSAPVYLNSLHNVMLRAVLARNQSIAQPGKFAIRLTNHPFPSDGAVLNYEQILQNNDILIAAFIAIALCFVPCSFVYLIVREKETKAIHLQWMAGLTPLMYWNVTIVTDLLNYFLPAALTLLVVWLFHMPIYVQEYNFLAIVYLVIFYGLASIPLVYVISLFFKTNASSSYITLVMSALFLNISTIFTAFLLQMFGYKNNFLNKMFVHCDNLFRIFPGYSLARGIMVMVIHAYEVKIEQFANTNDESDIKTIFQSGDLTPYFWAMWLVAVVCYLVTIVFSYIPRIQICERKVEPLTERENERLEVTEERERVKRIAERGGVNVSVSLADVSISGVELGMDKKKEVEKEDMLLIDDLVVTHRSWRIGRSVHAVKGISVAVEPGSCFGLLGVNGAGKTTTFSVLSGQCRQNSGSVTMGGQQIVLGGDALLRLGFCPQFDALYDDLTVLEHLRIYALMHGYACCSITPLAHELMARFDLSRYARVRAGNLSGGTKRKLSLAMALCGAPACVLLDEPTTGMDPRSRWRILKALGCEVQAGRSALLTTHSMEEVEALCGRLAIMVNGRFECIGSPQYIKATYGAGYVLRLRLAGGGGARRMRRRTRESLRSRNDSVSSVTASVSREAEAVWSHLVDELQRRVPDLTVKETHSSVVQLESLAHPLPALFSAARELLTGRPEVAGWNITQNGLDQAFVGFVREQRDDATENAVAKEKKEEEEAVEEEEEEQ